MEAVSPNIGGLQSNAPAERVGRPEGLPRPAVIEPSCRQTGSTAAHLTPVARQSVECVGRLALGRAQGRGARG